MKMINLIIKIKPLYRILKKIRRSYLGIVEDRRCLNQPVVDYLMKFIKKGDLVLEIGSAFGQTTKDFAKKAFVITVDPFIEDERGQIMGEYFEDITREFLKNIKGKNISFFPMKSKDAFIFWDKYIKKEFDFIFLDGYHEYDDVNNDYKWIKFLKKGGYIVFHDTVCPQLDLVIKQNEDQGLKFISGFGNSIKTFRKDFK